MVKLGKATIAAQQKLSNKEGIATFNTSGGISTVPTSGKINSAINVGLGKFSSKKSLNVAIQSKIQLSKNNKSSGGKKSSVFKNSPVDAPSKKTPRVPLVLSPRTIAAQQALSDLEGIPTFNLSGGISTIPSNLNFSEINVGFGKFKTEDSFVDAILHKANEPFRAPTISGGGSSGILSDISNFFTELFNPPVTDVPSGFTTEDTGLGDESSDTIQDPFLFGGSGGQSGDIAPSSENDESFIDSIIKDPLKLGIGIVVIAALVFGTGGGKKRRR